MGFEGLWFIRGMGSTVSPGVDLQIRVSSKGGLAVGASWSKGAGTVGSLRHKRSE